MQKKIVQFSYFFLEKITLDNDMIELYEPCNHFNYLLKAYAYNGYIRYKRKKQKL